MSKGNTTKAFRWFEALKTLIKFSRTAIWDRAELLFLGKEKEYYKILGYEDWNQFINDPELQLSKTQVFRDLKLFKRFIYELKIPKKLLYGINSRRLDSIASYLTKKTVEEWLEKTKNLSDYDFDREVKRIFKGRKDPITCKHEHVKTIDPKIICEECGERVG